MDTHTTMSLTTSCNLWSWSVIFLLVGDEILWQEIKLVSLSFYIFKGVMIQNVICSVFYFLFCF